MWDVVRGGSASAESPANHRLEHAASNNRSAFNGAVPAVQGQAMADEGDGSRSRGRS